MSEQTEPAWPTEQDATWVMTLRREAIMHHNVPPEALGSEVGAVHDAVFDTGSSAAELFGPPEDYAAELARGLAPEVRAEQPDWPFSSVWLLLGSAALGAAAFGWLNHGWSADVTSRAAVLAGVITIGAPVAVAAVRRWRSGRCGPAVAVVAGLLAILGVGAVLALRTPPDDVLIPRFPLVLVAALGVGLLGLWLRSPDGPEVVEAGAVGTPEAYFGRLEGLLRGRHHLSAATARAQTARAREHYAASGSGHPFDEFGAPQSYALDLADQTTESATRGRWLYPALAVVVGLVLLSQVVDQVADGTDGRFWTVIGLLATGLAMTAAGWFLKRR